MAGISYFVPVDMRTDLGYSATITDRFPTQVVARSGDITINVFGVFTYSGNAITGVVREIRAEKGQNWISSGLFSDAPVATFISGDKVSTAPLNAIQTLSGSDYISVSSSSYALGGAGDDTMSGGFQSNDTFDGGPGKDTVSYANPASSFSVRAEGAGYSVVSAKTPIDYGTDTLLNIETIRFTDAKLALGQDTRVAQIYRLYEAAFNRDPDIGGLSFWVGQLEQRWPSTRLADAFMGSPEFKAAYGASPSNAELVDLLYRNVLDRPADAGGTAFWNGRLADGMSRSDLLVHFAESAENRANVASEIANGILYADSYAYVF
jgi:hypothetical protein